MSPVDGVQDLGFSFEPDSAEQADKKAIRIAVCIQHAHVRTAVVATHAVTYGFNSGGYNAK